MPELMHGWARLLKLTQNALKELTFDYFVDIGIKDRVNRAAMAMQEAKDLVDPKDSRVGRASICTEIKLTANSINSFNSAMTEGQMTGKRINQVAAAGVDSVNHIIQLLMAKNSVESVERKINKVADTNLRESLASNLVAVKQKKQRSAVTKDTPTADPSMPYSQLKDVNDGLIKEGAAFHLRLAETKWGKKPKTIFARCSLIVVADPVITASQLANAGLDYVMMAGVLILRNQRLAVMYDPEKKHWDTLGAKQRAEEKFGKKYVDVLEITANGQDTLAIRGFPALRAIWLMENQHYTKMGGFKLKTLGFPWNN
jgi:hypothetical protein